MADGCVSGWESVGLTASYWRLTNAPSEVQPSFDRRLNLEL